MKKLIALVLSIVMICCLSVTAFAAESPEATEKVTVTIRKATVVEPAGKVDTEYTYDVGTTITLKADAKYGTFNSWSIYKEAATPATGMVTLNVAKAAGAKYVEAVAGTDYEIVKGSLTTSEITIKLNAEVIVCGNYNNVITAPGAASNADDSANAPATGDMTFVYAAFVMVACAAFAFGVKKVYSK